MFLFIRQKLQSMRIEEDLPTIIVNDEADAVPVLTAAWMSSTGVHGSVDNWRLGGAEKLAVCAMCR